MYTQDCLITILVHNPGPEPRGRKTAVFGANTGMNTVLRMDILAAAEATCFFTRLEESSLVPAEFLAANRIYESFVLQEKKKMEVLFIASMENKKSEDKFIHHTSSFSILPLFSRKAVKEAPANPRKKQMPHELRFLQKLGCEKSCWDQARLPQPGK